MKNEIYQYLLGDVTPAFLVAFYVFATFGVILSMLFHYGKKRKKQVVKFNFNYWLKDNLIRFFTSIMCVFIVVRFFDELPIDMELNMFLALCVGVTLDQVIIFIRNKTSINIFQNKAG